MIPFDLLFAQLAGEPLCLSRDEIAALDPVSAKLLYFRDRKEDETALQGAPKMPYHLERFFARFRAQGYTTKEIEELWAKNEDNRRRKEADDPRARKRRGRPKAGRTTHRI